VHYEAQATDGGSNELRAQDFRPHGEVGQEKADEVCYVAAPATVEDEGSGHERAPRNPAHMRRVRLELQV
jgi:hypothetical protein